MMMLRVFFEEKHNTAQEQDKDGSSLSLCWPMRGTKIGRIYRFERRDREMEQNTKQK